MRSWILFSCQKQSGMTDRSVTATTRLQDMQPAGMNPTLPSRLMFLPDNEYASYSMSSMPTEPVVAATFNKELVEREGELFGEDGLWSNANSIAAPGLNIHRAPYCSRNHEILFRRCHAYQPVGTGCLQRRKIQRSYDDARNTIS
ncbi:MAG: hypothetical protein ACLTER_27220 [Ruminococcus sp.]